LNRQVLQNYDFGALVLLLAHYLFII